MILECVYCDREIEWDKTENPNGPGSCSCGTQISAPWRVCKAKRPVQRGFVRVLDDNGWKDITPSSTSLINKILRKTL